jgi:hypothetical protein
MKKVDQSTRWSPAQLPELWFQKKKRFFRFSLLNLCTLTGLVCVAAWSTAIAHRVGGGWELPLIGWSTVAAGVVGLLFGHVIRPAVAAFVIVGFLVLALAWFIGLTNAIDYEEDNLSELPPVVPLR